MTNITQMLAKDIKPTLYLSNVCSIRLDHALGLPHEASNALSMYESFQKL